MLQLTTKLMNRLSDSITTHFIPNNKDYHSRKYNCMNEIFPNIDHKFYSNVTTHNQTNEN